ncbi:MAG: damage-inducible mutagenesis protein [Gluconacetobacter diazotrophicus]|nr:damage-inducible mutagenesis protein [Gluconacetobacter diazotrophicus]
MAAFRALRAEIAVLERSALARTEAAPVVLPFGIRAIDDHLPNGGLLLGAVHELCGGGPDTEHAAVPAGFAAALLARHPGPVVWVSRCSDLFATGLSRFGLDPYRLLLVRAGRDALSAMEEALRHPGLSGVVCELDGRFPSVASRRLQLAAERSTALGLVLRRSHRFDDPAFAAPTAARTRWRISGLPSPPPLPHAPTVRGVGRARWRLELRRCRGAEPATWTVEAPDASGRLALAAVLADRPAASPAVERAAG